ncbi:glycosyl transferase family 2 [Alteribacter lacisalsi]|uniref:Glycosyl transferase family 2 n=1 Tax=Alteribacter lacisalsi TaxID=2045244 RepID=A0A2W0H9K3_9BACI|nr:glycosyltransferase family 2 protein [Alteribacter lacisalsi]PYZ98523.1 glycosyl transferase family 2 [Alteribacter lacisalsi]
MTVWILTAVLAVSIVITGLNTFLLPRLKTDRKADRHPPSVDVFVPLRNEERNVPDLIASLKGLTAPNLTFFLLDDGSSDRTGELLTALTDDDPRFYLLKGKPLPEAWVGKVHACHQLSKNGSGEFALFVDADVRLAHGTVESLLSCFKRPETGLVTGFPKTPAKGVLGSLLIPMQHFVVHFHLPVLLANYTTFAPATAAHGAFMMFRRSAYEKAGGHKAVKSSLVEDVHLARQMKKSGYRVTLANVSDAVTCYMYETDREVWEGFSKNLFPGLGRSLPLAVFVTLFYLLFYTAPGIFAILVLLGSLEMVWLLPYSLGVVHKGIVDWSVRQKLWLCILMPASALMTVVLLWYSAFLGVFRRGFSWKGRVYK